MDSAPPATPLRVLGIAANGSGDAVALEMLGRLLSGLPIALENTSSRMLASDMIALVRAQQYTVVCIADLPPSPPSKTRYLIRRLRAAFPDLRIVVGRWAPPALADETLQPLADAGATHMAATLLDTRKQLIELSQAGARPAPGAANAAA
jgi:hypothetical protein